MSSQAYDIAIIGGGIVGLATALQLSTNHPGQRAVVLEKETAIASHQTGHNSGVIHSGIYYRPGSLKARNCVEGGRALMAFCDENGIEYQLCGKVIVATDEREMAALDELLRRGTANGVPGLRMLGSRSCARSSRTPRHSRTPLAEHRHHRLRAGGRRLRKRFRENGGEVLTGARVMSIRRADGLTYLETDGGVVRARNVINCAGLYSDTIARMMGVPQDVRIVPFRGEYYMLAPEAEQW